MRAAYYDRTGPAAEVLKIGEVPTPATGPGEVRVKIAWSGVNPSDVKSRAGTRTKTIPFPRIVPHSDGSGVIDQVGRAVDRKRIGERVWVWNGAWGRAFGTAAEFIVLPTAQTVALPGDIDLAVGACFGIPALTAYHAVTVDGGVKDKSVLIAGGAGAVGHYAVQLAKLKGARQVIATVSSATKAELARSAGADIVINYKSEDAAAKVLGGTGGQGIDRIIEVDFAANVNADLAMVRRGGEIVVYGSGAGEIPLPFVGAILKNVRMRFFIVYNLGDADRERAVSDLTGLLGGLTHNIAARFPLERIAEAHDTVEQGRAIGNVLIKIE